MPLSKVLVDVTINTLLLSKSSLLPRQVHAIPHGRRVACQSCPTTVLNTRARLCASTHYPPDGWEFANTWLNACIPRLLCPRLPSMLMKTSVDRFTARQHRLSAQETQVSFFFIHQANETILSRRSSHQPDVPTLATAAFPVNLES